MKNTAKIRSGFTLVELLVVITILSIISVVAYQNFGGAVDKALSGRKISDVSTIETSLQQYKVDKNYYPSVDLLDTTTNLWGYNDAPAPSAVSANRSNTLVVARTAGSETIDSITSAVGGWRVYGIDGSAVTDGADWTDKQVWAKGTISQATLTKQYLTKDLYDPSLGDIKVGTDDTMITYGLGRYVYWVFKKPLDLDTDWWTNKSGTYYNIAYTVKKDGSDEYITKLVWDYDAASCFDDSMNCPESLIGTSNNVLLDGEVNRVSSTNVENQGIPYPIDNY